MGTCLEPNNNLQNNWWMLYNDAGKHRQSYAGWGVVVFIFFYYYCRPKYIQIVHTYKTTTRHGGTTINISSNSSIQVIYQCTACHCCCWLAVCKLNATTKNNNKNNNNNIVQLDQSLNKNNNNETLPPTKMHRERERVGASNQPTQLISIYNKYIQQ